MTSKWTRIALLVLCASLCLGAVFVEPALAKSSDIGKNIGDEIDTWAKAILFGLVGLCAIPIIVKRDLAGGMVLVLLGVTVGGFVFAQGAVKDIITSLWTSIGG